MIIITCYNNNYFWLLFYFGLFLRNKMKGGKRWDF